MAFSSTSIRSVALVFVLLTAAASVRAECVSLSAKQVMKEARYELVFSGKVVSITRTADAGYRATFDVDRVWKGSVLKSLDLYVWELAAEMPRFEVGHRYVVLAQRLVDGRARAGVGLGSTNSVAFAPAPCSDGPTQGPTMLRDLGAGRPPKAQ